MAILIFALLFIFIIGYGALAIRQNSSRKLIYAGISLAGLFIAFGVFAYMVTSLDVVSH